MWLSPLPVFWCWVYFRGLWFIIISTITRQLIKSYSLLHIVISDFSIASRSSALTSSTASPLLPHLRIIYYFAGVSFLNYALKISTDNDLSLIRYYTITESLSFAWAHDYSADPFMPRTICLLRPCHFFHFSTDCSASTPLHFIYISFLAFSEISPYFISPSPLSIFHFWQYGFRLIHRPLISI